MDIFHQPVIEHRSLTVWEMLSWSFWGFKRCKRDSYNLTYIHQGLQVSLTIDLKNDQKKKHLIAWLCIEGQYQ